MDRNFYILDYRLDGMVSHLIWLSNDTDGVVLDGDGKIPAFRELPELRGFAAHLGLTLQAHEPGSKPVDLDEVKRWLEAPKAGITCEVFLGSWNLFDDVARSVRDSEFMRLSKEASGVYDKLFWGSNLPAVTPPGEHFEPVWSNQEEATLRQVLVRGMTVLRRHLRDDGARMS